eukprot:213441_1
MNHRQFASTAVAARQVMAQVDLHKMSTEELANWLQSGPVPEAADYVREVSITGEDFYSQLSYQLMIRCSKDDRRRAILLDHIFSVTETYRERMHKECSEVGNLDNFIMVARYGFDAEDRIYYALCDLHLEKECANLEDLLPSQMETARDIVQSIREKAHCPSVLCYPPGFGKTTLLRGLSHAINNENSTSRKLLNGSGPTILPSDCAAYLDCSVLDSPEISHLRGSEMVEILLLYHCSPHISVSSLARNMIPVTRGRSRFEYAFYMYLTRSISTKKIFMIAVDNIHVLSHNKQIDFLNALLKASQNVRCDGLVLGTSDFTTLQSCMEKFDSFSPTSHVFRVPKISRSLMVQSAEDNISHVFRVPLLMAEDISQLYDNIIDDDSWKKIILVASAYCMGVPALVTKFLASIKELLPFIDRNASPQTIAGLVESAMDDKRIQSSPEVMHLWVREVLQYGNMARSDVPQLGYDITAARAIREGMFLNAVARPTFTRFRPHLNPWTMRRVARDCASRCPNESMVLLNSTQLPGNFLENGVMHFFRGIFSALVLKCDSKSMRLSSFLSGIEPLAYCNPPAKRIFIYVDISSKVVHSHELDDLCGQLPAFELEKGVHCILGPNSDADFMDTIVFKNEVGRCTSGDILLVRKLLKIDDLNEEFLTNYIQKYQQSYAKLLVGEDCAELCFLFVCLNRKSPDYLSKVR